ncbi:hypothetical protein D3C87_573840 [compost metagenome]
MNAREAYKTLEKMVNVFAKFDGQHVEKVRKELHKTIKKFESGEYGWQFLRKDDEETKRVKLWAYQETMDHNMHPDFEIGIDENNKIWIQNDILWKTLYGLKEQMEEESAYQYKYGRD